MPDPTDPKKPLSPTSAAVRIAKPSAGEPAPTMRLNKRMAELGICSRREADDWIARGWVRVNEALAALQEQGSIRIEYGGLRVLDLAALRSSEFTSKKHF